MPKRERALRAFAHTVPTIVRLEKVEGLRTFSDYAFFKDDSEYVDWPTADQAPLRPDHRHRLGHRRAHLDESGGARGTYQPQGSARPRPAPYRAGSTYNYVLATETVLVSGLATARMVGRPSARDAFVENGPYLRAFDLDTGAVLAEMEFPGQPNGSPISYMADGVSISYFPINDDDWVPQLFALALPGVKAALATSLYRSTGHGKAASF